MAPPLAPSRWRPEPPARAARLPAEHGAGRSLEPWLSSVHFHTLGIDGVLTTATDGMRLGFGPLEAMQDADDVLRLRREPTRPLRDLIRDLGLDGEIWDRRLLVIVLEVGDRKDVYR